MTCCTNTRSAALFHGTSWSAVNPSLGPFHQAHLKTRLSPVLLQNSTAEQCQPGDVTSSSPVTSSAGGKTTTRLCLPGEDPAFDACIAPSVAYSNDYTPVMYETSPASAGRPPVVQAWTTHRRVGAGAAIGISLAITVLVALTGIITFAYNRPQSRSGQWLIQV